MKRNIILIVTSLLSLLSVAQDPRFDVPSPTAAELCRYGDIPVSYYTGKADISLPLYSLTVKGVTLPITLHYDASGMMPNNLPGWTGDNWSLSAGGVITRIVQGFPDEYQKPSTTDPEIVDHNYFQSYNSLSNIMLLPNPSQAIKDSIRLRKCDFSPDLFYFNFMGKTGRFFLGNDGEWKVYSEENLEVIFDYQNSNNLIYPFVEYLPHDSNTYKQGKTIAGFVIRDIDGTEYHFGGSTDFIEYSLPFFRQSAFETSKSWMANSWYLRKITDRNGNLLFSFSYQRGKFIAQLYNYGYKISVACSYNHSGIHQNFTVGPFNNLLFPYDGVLCSPVYLTGISSGDGKSLSFISSDWNISVLDLYSSMYNNYSSISKWKEELLRAFDLRNPFNVSVQGRLPFYYLQTNDPQIVPYQYNPTSNEKYINPLVSMRLRMLNQIIYKTNNVINSSFLFDYETASRLCLKSIRKADKYGLTEGKFQLKYGTQRLTCNYLTTAIDDWGYYNGWDVGIFPPQSGVYVDISKWHKINPSAVGEGMLTEITYPTGGKTMFEYESHDYSQYVSNSRSNMVSQSGIAGGVRIKSITNYEDSCSNVLSKHIFTYTISGTNVSSGQLYAKPQNFWSDWSAVCVDSHSNATISISKSSSIIPLANKFGTHISYSCVKDSIVNERTILMNFSNISDALDSYFDINFSNNTPSPYDAFTERDYKRGKLLSRSTYDKNGQLKEIVSYVYRADYVENSHVWTSNVNYDNFTPKDLNYRERYDHYTGGIYKLFYPKYDVKYELTTIYEDNGTIFDRKTYNRTDHHFQVSYGNYSHWADARFLTSEVTERQNYSQQTLYEYANWSNDTVTKKLLSQQFYLQPTAVEHKYQGSRVSRTETLFRRFPNGLILPRCELQYKGTVPDTLISYYDYTPSGAVARYKEQGAAETTLTWWMNDNYLLSKNIGGSLLTTYTYNPSSYKLTRITQPNGNYESYTYDDMGRLSEIRDRNGQLKKKFTYNFRNK